MVGVPNAGKSSLLAAATNAKPKIAPYAFTTVTPNLGVWRSAADTEADARSLAPRGLRRGRAEAARPSLQASLVLADIPGLLEGAHEGKGLGRAFLRHIERCRLLLHVVDGTRPDPLGDFEVKV